MKKLGRDRLLHLRTGAEVGMRMGGLYPHTVHVDPEELAALLDEVLAGRENAVGAEPEPAVQITGRMLTLEEKRLVLESLRAQSKKTRQAKSEAVMNPHRSFEVSQSAHIEELSRRAGDLDRLANELADYHLRLEKLPS